MAQGYGFITHHIKHEARAGMFAVVDCQNRNAQVGSKDWNEVTCKRCLSHRPVGVK